MTKRRRSFRSILVLPMFGCLLALEAVRSTAQQPSPSAAARTNRISRADLDTICAACSDFYRFGNGGWLRGKTISPSDAEVTTLSTMYDRNQGILRALIEDAARSARAGQVNPASDRYRVGVYNTCMDTALIEQRGAHPLAASLRRIAAIRPAADLPTAFAALERSDGIAPFTAFLIPDLKNSNRIIPVLVERALSLPGKDYYLWADTSKGRIRAAFLGHVSRTLSLTGEAGDSAEADARVVLEMETALARVKLDAATFRMSDSVYHLLTIAQLDSLTPHINWSAFLRPQGAPGDLVDIDVTEPRFIRAVDSLMTSAPVNDWRVFLRWRLVHTSSQLLASRFVEEPFVFDRLFGRQEEDSPRWQTCTSLLMRDLGQAVGREHVRENFDSTAKPTAGEMVAILIAVLRERVSRLEWMSNSTDGVR